MNEQLIEIVTRELASQETEALLEIWEQNDRDAYTDEAFEALRRILRQRLGGDLPPQGAPGMGGLDPRTQEYLPPPGAQDRMEIQRRRREIGTRRKYRLEAEIEAHLAAARQYDDQDRLQEALAEYDWVLEKAPRRAAVHHARGLALEDLDRLEDAIAAYRQASSLEPGNAEYLQDWERALLIQAEQRGLDSLPQGDDEEPPELEPPAPFLEAKSWLRGWPGNRTLPERSGLDYVDTNAELGHMEGLFLRSLFTGRLRTDNPFYLFLMALAGSLVLLVGGAILATRLPLLVLCFSVPMIVIGIALLLNFLLILHYRE